MRTARQRISLLRTSPILVAALLGATPAVADVVTDWNAKTISYVNAAGRPAPAWILDTAMVHLAMHDAVQAYQQRFGSYNEPIVGASGSPVAAVATAARDVLVNRLAPQAGAIHAAYLDYLAQNGLLITDAGVHVGQESARRMIERRAFDGSFPAIQEVVTGGLQPGIWRPTQPGFQPMSAPWMGDVTPFALRDVAGVLHEPGPPHLTSGHYARDYNEVKTVGARFGSSRTAEQTSLANFYSGNFLTIMNGIARSVAIARGGDIGDSARLLALVNVSAADALIAAWANKRSYPFWRPSTAIANGEDDGNPRTDGDPLWLPLFNDPPYPDYTSGANSITAATMRTLSLFFGSDTETFSATTTVAGEPARTYTRFSAVADVVVNARVYMGIHFRFADEVARRQGEKAADWAFDHVLKPLE
jgi:hypothetical protein